MSHFTSFLGYNVTEVFDGKAMGVKKSTDVISVMVNPTGIFLGKATPLH